MQGMYSQQQLNGAYERGERSKNPWEVQKDVKTRDAIEMKALSNDFTINKQSLKLE